MTNEPIANETAAGIADRALGSRVAARWERLDAWLERASEYVNPILVKETRQALKSRQFLVWFSLLLLAGWLWSIGVVFQGQGIYFGGGGAEVFVGYFAILCFPLIVVIPFGAYRSLAAEWEDGTYDLMSISTLTPRQIITGKLGSAIIQMIVYLSAIAPCIAFTYLLRGLDVVTIFWLLFWLCTNSLFATVLALCLATGSRSRAWQVVISIILIAAFMWNFFGAMAFTAEVAFSSWLRFDDTEFWVANGAMLTGVFGWGLMFLLIARARLMFPTENRSTALRMTMLLQFALFSAWFGGTWIYLGRLDPEAVLAYVCILAAYWYVMGMFMTGEAGELSPRVRRDLPQSFLGRVFLTWLNPGSGTGYVFAVSSLLAACVLAVMALETAHSWITDPEVRFGGYPADFLSRQQQMKWWAQRDARNIAATKNIACFTLCYVTIYLGLGRLLILALRRRVKVDLFASFLLHLGLFAVANLLPLTIQAAIVGDIDDRDYNLGQALSPIWTLVTAGDVPHRFPMEIDALWLLLPGLATAVFLFNLPGIARETAQQRIAKPHRVAEDDAQLHPPPEPKPTSPWD